MGQANQHENVNRFVASARRLIIIQIIVAIIALVAAIAATVLIWRAFVEQGEAAKATRLATIAQEEATDAKNRADEAIQNSQREQRRIATMRTILQATTWQDYANAADALEETARQIPDEDVYALLASAQYRAGAEENPDRAGRLVKATGLLLEATRLNKKRVNEADIDQAADAQTSHNAELYVEYIGVQCAALKSSRSGSADILNSLQLLDIPDIVIAQIERENRLRESAIIQRECDPGYIESIEALYGMTSNDSLNTTPEPSYQIDKIFMHISDERDRSIAAAISADLEQDSDIQVPGTERIVSDASAYKASVRYYHQEQLQQAQSIQSDVLESARASGATWSESDIPLIKLNLKDLPRDRIEVWLPSQSSLRATRRAKSDISDSVSVLYYQRGADGLTVLNTLETLFTADNIEVDSSEVGLDAVNTLTCSPDASASTMDSLKLLATSLLDAGIKLNQVTVSETNPDNTRIEVRHAPVDDGLEILSADDIRAIETCTQVIAD